MDGMPNDRFVIAWHSPDGYLKPDCLSALRRKELQNVPSGLGGHFLRVRIQYKICGIGEIFGDFQRKAAELLCSSDLLAEGGEFEPRVRFL
jgi:hypothetical protein